MAKHSKDFQIVRYVSRVPRQVPSGLVLVHNFQPAPMQGLNIGLNGFRCFYVAADELRGEKPCPCGWAPYLTHFNPSGRTIPQWMQMRSNPQPLDTLARLKALRPKLSHDEIAHRMASIHGIFAASKTKVVQTIKNRTHGQLPRPKRQSQQ
jgi:hypothetical protein